MDRLLEQVQPFEGRDRERDDFVRLADDDGGRDLVAVVGCPEQQRHSFAHTALGDPAQVYGLEKCGHVHRLEVLGQQLGQRGLRPPPVGAPRGPPQGLFGEEGTPAPVARDLAQRRESGDPAVRVQSRAVDTRAAHHCDTWGTVDAQAQQGEDVVPDVRRAVPIVPARSGAGAVRAPPRDRRWPGTPRRAPPTGCRPGSSRRLPARPRRGAAGARSPQRQPRRGAVGSHLRARDRARLRPATTSTTSVLLLPASIARTPEAATWSREFTSTRGSPGCAPTGCRSSGPRARSVPPAGGPAERRTPGRGHRAGRRPGPAARRQRRARSGPR